MSRCRVLSIFFTGSFIASRDERLFRPPLPLKVSESQLLWLNSFDLFSTDTRAWLSGRSRTRDKEENFSFNRTTNFTFILLIYWLLTGEHDTEVCLCGSIRLPYAQFLAWLRSFKSELRWLGNRVMCRKQFRVWFSFPRLSTRWRKLLEIQFKRSSHDEWNLEYHQFWALWNQKWFSCSILSVYKGI